MRKWSPAQEAFEHFAYKYREEILDWASDYWQNTATKTLIEKWASKDKVSVFEKQYIKDFNAFEFEVPHFNFKDPKSAIEAFKGFDFFKCKYEIYSIFTFEENAVTNICRKKWLEMLIKAAPANCKLVVIKGSDSLYYPYNEERFNNDCKHGKISAVCEGPFPIWISFDPADGVPNNTDDWMISKNPSHVSYVVE